jgi:acetyltransferase-like isoleucine patch superfamily enzyme
MVERHLYLVRHAEARKNVGGRQGGPGTELTAASEAQARRLGACYGDSIDIGEKVLIGRNTVLLGHGAIVIGDGTMIGPNVTMSSSEQVYWSDGTFPIAGVHARAGPHRRERMDRRELCDSRGKPHRRGGTSRSSIKCGPAAQHPAQTHPDPRC